MTKRFFFFQLGSIVKATHQSWGFTCPLTTFLFLGRIAQQWYSWNPLTKGKVLRPTKNKSKQENKFWRLNFLCSSESLLPMQVSVCPSVCLSVCPSANYSYIMARMDFSHPEAVSRHPKAQKWLPSNFCDLWLSIDTKNSTLWAVVLANPAVKRPWRKMKIFMQKYVKIENFWYMRVIYIKRKLRTCTIQIQREKVWFFPKKKFF